MATVPGITDLAVLRSLGQPTVRIDVDRARAARYGLAPGDINADGTGGDRRPEAGDLYEEGSDRHFPMVVRLAAPYRQNLEAIRRIPIGAPAARQRRRAVPLGDVADVQLVSGASFIYREQQERYVPIKFSVRGRDLGGAVLEAQRGRGRRWRPRRLPARMGGRVRQSAGGHRPPRGRRADRDRADLRAAVRQLRQR